jgi:hypothetical protein
MKHRLLGLLLISGLTLPSWATAQEPTVVPVTKAPFHLFTFQDENMSLENVAVLQAVRRPITPTIRISSSSSPAAPRSKISH